MIQGDPKSYDIIVGQQRIHPESCFLLCVWIKNEWDFIFVFVDKKRVGLKP
jgi:hypothetical protein